MTPTEKLDRDGFAVVDHFATAETVDALLNALGSDVLGGRAGARLLHKRIPAVAEFLQRAAAHSSIHEVMEDAFPVRSILFDKTADKNWGVAWHQDLSICVKERHEVTGFSAWSIKEGVMHVQPPPELLERMLTIRLHLDDCGEENGPLQVIRGSHRHGRLSSDEIATWRNEGSIVTCSVQAGGAVFMKPLILHSSSPAKSPLHRRVLHIEFAAEPLPEPLSWIC
ncbi:MAG: phytanoyl-CoA dioxygenase family protein [Verrucomicrobiales bacterium]